MSKGLEKLKEIKEKYINDNGLQRRLAIIEKELEVLEFIKKHILDRNMDTSGIYLEFHNGHYEPYYTIEIRDGIKQIVSPKEYDLLKEALL